MHTHTHTHTHKHTYVFTTSGIFVKDKKALSRWKFLTFFVLFKFIISLAIGFDSIIYFFITSSNYHRIRIRDERYDPTAHMNVSMYIHMNVHKSDTIRWWTEKDDRTFQKEIDISSHWFSWFENEENWRVLFEWCDDVC